MKYLILSILLLILSILHVTFPITLAFTKVLGPAQQSTTFQAENIKNFFIFFDQMRTVAQDYENLYAEYQSLEQQNARLNFLKEENEQLRQQLKVVNSEEVLKNKAFVFTYIYANPSDKSGSTMLMNAGTVSGVHKGDVVIKDNNLIGIVKNSTSGKSVVELITSPTLKIPVYNFSSTAKHEGIVNGKFGTSIVLENILPTETVKEGDVLMTSTRNPAIPPNLIVGKIVRIEGDSASTVKSAFIESLTDFKNLRRVYVLVE